MPNSLSFHINLCTTVCEFQTFLQESFSRSTRDDHAKVLEPLLHAVAVSPLANVHMTQ